MSEIEAKEYNALVELIRSVAESSSKAINRSEIALRDCERMIGFAEQDFIGINTEINSIKKDLYLMQERLSSIKYKPVHDIITTVSGAIIALFCIFKIGEAFF